MKLSFKTILPIILISALLILLAGCFGVPTDESPGYTPGTITGIIAAPCCSTSAEPVSETCCVSPEYWCFYCQKTWSLQEGIEVVLTYGEDEVATVFTNKDGEFTFTNLDPGKNYVITAYCPDFADNRPLVKDVALEVASTFDTGITDLVSTSLGLVVDFLVLYTDWGPEDISLDAVLADRPNFPNFPKFKKLIYEVRRVLENCELNLLTDDEVQYRTCLAAEEISGLDIGCGAGFTPPPGPPPPVPPGECDGNLLPDITDVTQDGTSIFNIEADIHLTVGTPYEFCVTAADNDNILPQALIYYLTIDGVDYSTGNSNCMTITPETEDVDSNPHEVFVNVYDGCDTKTWGPITVIVDCCPFDEPGLTINIEEPVANEMGIEMSKNGEPEPIPDITICMEDCAIINSVTIHYGGTYPLPDLVITPSYINKGLSWDVDSGISFDPTTGEICLTSGVVDTNYDIDFTYTDECGETTTGTVTVEFKDCTCIPPTADADGPYTETVCPGTAATIVFDSTVTSGTGPFTYDWDFGDGSLHGTVADPSHEYPPAGAKEYDVTLKVTNACGDSTYDTTVTISEYPLPQADANGTYGPYEVCPGDEELVALTGSATGHGPFDYAWDLDNNGVFDDSLVQNPTWSFGKGVHTIGLQVTDACDNTATDTTTVTITECINQAPVIGTIPTQKISATAPCKVEYKYTIPATDPDGDKLTFSLVLNKNGYIPSGMTINSSTGEIGGNEEWVVCCGGGERCHRCCTVWVKVKVEDVGCCGPLETYKEFPIEIWDGWIGYEDCKKVYGRGFDNCPYFCN